MKRLLFLCALLATLVLASSNRAQAESDQDFHLFNRTGVDIHQLYVSPSGSDNWEEDLLNGKVLQNGADVVVTFDGKSKAKLFDILIKDAEGNGLYWRKINLLEVSEVILEADGKARLK